MTANLDEGGAGRWGEWSRHVLGMLEKHQAALDGIRLDIGNMNVRFGEMAVRFEAMKQDLAEARATIASLATARDLAEVKERMGALADAKTLAETKVRLETAEQKVAELQTELRIWHAKAVLVSGIVALTISVLGLAAKFIWK